MAPGLDELYKILEVPRNADLAAVKKSYRTLVLKYHPDKNPDDREAAGKKIRDINAAYAVLGNPSKRAAQETHAEGSECLLKATSRIVSDYTTAAHRRNDVLLPTHFFLQPLGSPDKFLRCVDRSLSFHAREDAKTAGFDEFFATATFAIYWLPEANNPDRKAKFGGQCRLQTRPSMGKDGSMLGTSGWLSFGLCPGVSSSDVMLSPTTAGLSSPELTDLILVPSPAYPRTFRFESAYFPGHFFCFDPPTQCLMTGSKDQFSTIDFMFEEVNTCHQFQTLDEVLLPVLKSLGGDVIYVKLTTICQDPSVRQFFQLGMKCEWDFDDFAIYFHAHDEIWDYNAGQQSLRIRSKKDEGSKPPPAKRSKPSVPKRPPTKVLLLENLVGAGEVDSDLEEETAEEAGKYGKVNKCTIKEIKGVPDEEAVRIFLEFEAVESASKAFDVFEGRLFAGRTVNAQFYDEALYKEGSLEKPLT